MDLKKGILLGAGLGLLVLGIFIYNTTDLASQAIRYQLGVYGTSIYEYRVATGRWPESAADLARTSIPGRFRHWQDELLSGTVVVIWPHNMEPNPRDNGHRILAYFNGGLIARFGRKWVLWGDLRTEYLPNDKLTTALQAAKD